MKNTIKRSYHELITFKTFEERLKYLQLEGIVGETTFGAHRYLNQILYKSSEWKSSKRKIIIRDNGCDLGCEDFPIVGNIYIHHINPITIEDILQRRFCVFDPDNLISTSFNTHNLIHYINNKKSVPQMVIERTKNDTCIWR